MSSVDSVSITSADGMKQAIAIARDLTDDGWGLNIQVPSPFKELEFFLPFSRDSAILLDEESMLIDIRGSIPGRISKVFCIVGWPMIAPRNGRRRSRGGGSHRRGRSVAMRVDQRHRAPK